MNSIDLVLGALAVWRATHLLHAEAGPAQAFERLRHWAGSGAIGQVLNCFYCLSLWLSLPVALLLGAHWIEVVLLWLGLSAVAILLERVTTKTSVVAEPVYMEDAFESDYPPIQPLDAGPLASAAR